jgi:hypothetical protein
MVLLLSLVVSTVTDLLTASSDDASCKACLVVILCIVKVLHWNKATETRIKIKEICVSQLTASYFPVHENRNNGRNVALIKCT